MLGDKEAIATIAVKDLAAAKKFYEGALGLKPLGAQGGEAITYQSGSAKLIVYRSEYAGTNKATAANWWVGEDIDEVARGLKAKGVPFEHYDYPGMSLQGDVHVMEGMKIAWFKDPDGNILAIMNQ